MMRGQLRQALDIFDRLLEITEQAGAGMYAIQYQLLQAMVYHQMGREDESLTAFDSALRRANAGGFVRIILDEGESVQGLLHRAIRRGIEPEFAGFLLSALLDELEKASPGRESAPALVEPLTPRELEVLSLLNTQLSIPEIGAELFISVSTVRSHIKSIYAKLDAHSRHEAVSKADALKLLN
jgi:LuxR family maltose regulon positive regulatory protein